MGEKMRTIFWVENLNRR